MIWRMLYDAEIFKTLIGYAIVEERFLEITLTYEGINTWVAFGLSSTSSMPDTDIYYCQNRENIIGIESAFANGRCKFKMAQRPYTFGQYLNLDYMYIKQGQNRLVELVLTSTA